MCIEAINKDLPSDIRVFALKRVTPKFSSRHDCTARTYSYTLPSISFSPSDEQSSLKDYRIPSDRLQLANDVLSIFKGRKNFHNYTLGKLHFDRSARRTIISTDLSEPFVEGDIEFCRVTLKGESFMMHQIRKMIGTSLGVIRGLIPMDYLDKTFEDERYFLPKAPGLGLMLERVHFDRYAQRFRTHDPLIFDEYDKEIEQFRRDVIHPVIVETEIKENSMLNWLNVLKDHSFDQDAQEADIDNRLGRVREESPDVDWGESQEFRAKLKKADD